MDTRLGFMETRGMYEQISAFGLACVMRPNLAVYYERSIGERAKHSIVWWAGS
jgi:hypothetical protein